MIPSMQTYQKKPRPAARAVPHGRPAAAKAPQADPLRSVNDLSSIERTGHQVDLPSAIQSKMENAFGADLSSVKLYESQAVADAGADALTQGSHIAFAPGQLDLVSMHGQALLGHELSHVVSQARGEARGTGLLESHSLESRADREGMMAARGQSIYSGASSEGGGMTAAPAGMAGPVQARRRRRRNQEPAPVYGPQNRPSATDHRLGANDIEGDTFGQNMMDAALKGVDYVNNVSSTVESTASQREDKSYVLGGLGKRASAINENAAMGHVAAIGSTIGTLKNTYDTYKDMRETLSSDEKSKGDKAIAMTKHFASWGSDAAGTAKNLAGQIIQNETLNKTVGGYLEQGAAAGQIIAGGAKAIEAAKSGYNATSDRLAAENAGRMLAQDSEARARSGDETKIANDKFLRSIATNGRNAAKVRKAESVQKGVNAGMDMAIGSVSLIPGVGNVAALGGAAAKGIVNVGTEAYVDQKRKEAREKNLDNLSLRASLEKKLGMRDDLPEKKKNEIRHRAKHLANQITTGERGAMTNKVAGMHKTQSDIEHLNTLASQDDEEGERARKIANTMGIGANLRTGLFDSDAASAQINADFSRGDSAADQISAADAHQFTKQHTVQAELKRQQAAAEAKKQKQADKAARKQKKQQAIEHYNSLPEEARQRIRESNKSYKSNRDQYVKDQGIKWYQFSKKKQARLQYDVEHRHGDEYGGHDVSEKQAQLDAMKQAQTDKENAKLNRQQRAQARKDARKADRQYKKERDKQRELAGIKWFQFGKKKQFNEEYDYATGTKERPDANAPEGTATANANLPWYKRAGNHLKNKWYSMRRKHQRARDSFINEAEDYKQLSGWRRFKLAAQNPLAWIKSKTKSGKAATAKRNAEAAADDQLLEQLMNNPDSIGEDGSVSLPKNDKVSPEALQAAKGKLKPINSPAPAAAGGTTSEPLQKEKEKPNPIPEQQPKEIPGDPNLPAIQEAKEHLQPIPAQQPKEIPGDPNLPAVQEAKEHLQPIPERQPKEIPGDPNLSSIQEAKKKLKKLS